MHVCRQVCGCKSVNRCLCKGVLHELQGWFGLVYWGLTPQQQPGSYQGGEMMMMKSVFWWRKPEYPEETTDLRQVTDDTFHTYSLCPVRGLNLGLATRSPLQRAGAQQGTGEGAIGW